jgi:hypothetical protein
MFDGNMGHEEHGFQTGGFERFSFRRCHQRNMINRLLDGFEGKLTSSKWAKIAKCSQDTALRDIRDLLNRNILVKFTLLQSPRVERVVGVFSLRAKLPFY